MPANRCPNPTCEYFNRALPNNAKVCPWCSTPLGPAIPSTPSKPNPPLPNPPPPIYPQPTQPQSIPQPPIINQPTYQPPVEYSPPPFDPTQYQQKPQPQYVQPTPPIYPPPPPRLPLLKLIHTSGREFQWSGERGYIGRRGQNPPFIPEVDLTGIPNEGILSRRHASIQWDWQQNAYIIVDMSTNGIYLNGNPLSPGVQYRLLNGDSLQFGQDNLVRFTAYIM